MKRKRASGIMLTLLLMGVSILTFNIEQTEAGQAPQLLLETDKDIYKVGENVTVILANIGNETIFIGGYPAWQIYTYPEKDPVYPQFFATLAWWLEPGENDTFTWNQLNEFTWSFAEPGKYIVEDVYGWGLSAYFTIVAADIIVPYDYLTIQEAINNANEGDIIFVRAGTYCEHVVVNKTVSLVGEGANVTVINGNRWGRTVVVTANNVSLSNFRIEKGGLDIIQNDCNLFINGSSTKILNNDIVDSVILILVDSLSFDNIIKHNNLTEGTRGIILYSSNNTIARNYIVVEGPYNLRIFGLNNTIVDNYIKNEAGCPLTIAEGSDWNKILNNNIVSNAIGITIASSHNTIYHNNFFNSTQHVVFDKPVNNTWDNGYPSGGNYWSNYAGADFYSGPYQNETGRDGIGDTSYIIDENNQDNYPLVYPYPCPTMPWDITGPIEGVPDGNCDIRDIAFVASLFGSVKGDRRYDERADITGSIYLLPDTKIDTRDIALIAKHFGETYQ